MKINNVPTGHGPAHCAPHSHWSLLSRMSAWGVNSELPEMHRNPAAHRPFTWPALNNNNQTQKNTLTEFSLFSEKIWCRHVPFLESVRVFFFCFFLKDINSFVQKGHTNVIKSDKKFMHNEKKNCFKEMLLFWTPYNISIQWQGVFMVEHGWTNLCYKTFKQIQFFWYFCYLKNPDKCKLTM